MVRLVTLLCWTATLVCAQGSRNVVISQVYGGGGNAGAPLRHDFIELFNRGATGVDLTGWSIQYNSATGTTWQSTALRGTIQPGRYYLVQESAGADLAAPPLPEPDAQGEIMMSAATGQVRVVDPAGTIIDAFEYAGLSNTTAALRRGAGCVDTDSPGDLTRAAPQPRNSKSPAVDCSAAESPEPATISQIQGPGAESPLKGRLVTARGIVTAARNNGFWIQSAEPDNDPATSEGLFVFTGSAPAVERGMLVDVIGTVAEFRPASDPGSAPLTELTDPRVEILSRGQSIPTPVALRPNTDWERHEGMLVTAEALETVSPSVGSVFYSILAGQARPYPSPDPTEEIERLRIDMRPQAVEVASGMTVTGATGPLDFAFRTYTIVPQQGITTSAGMRQMPLPVPAAGEFTVASMNLQRFYDDKDDPGSADVVVTPAVLQSRVDRVARAIREFLHSPDIIGVQEAENIDVLRLVGRAAGDYDAHLFESNDPSGIDVGLLVKRPRVQVSSAQAVGSAQLWDRVPLVARLTVDGRAFTITVVHLRSLIGSGTAAVDEKRSRQAEDLARLIDERERAGEQVIVVGDFNTLPSDPLIATILGPMRIDLIQQLLPGVGYTYVHEGVAQTLDHILIGAAMHPLLTRFAVAHINADFPESQRYSDHDVPVAYFTLAPETLQTRPAAVVNAATFLSGPVAPLEIISIFGRGLNAPVTLDNIEAETTYTSTTQINAIVPAEVNGRTEAMLKVGSAPSMTLQVADTAPGIFSLGNGQGAILNQDYSVNGQQTPAARGSVIMIYATGGGVSAQSSTTVRIASRPAEVLYSGPAPGLVAGVLQINARVPEDAYGGGQVPVSISVAGATSPINITMAVR